MDDRLTKLLKYYAELLEKQPQENDSAANSFLRDEDSITNLGKVWTETKAEELRGRANSARKLAAEIRSKMSH